MKEMKPGILSAELMAGLGMTESTPPPWLVNMQRYGPPPSYPNMRIPGLSAPIPAGAQFGYHPGGWGKPPVDEYGRPLYGDVFGVVSTVDVVTEEVDKNTRWGELTKYESEEEEEESDEEEQEEVAGDEVGRNAGRKYKEDISGMETPNTMDGISTINSGLETPDIVDLRKRAGGSETPDLQYSQPRELYTVIQERAANATAKGQLFGSDRAYVLPGKGDVVAAINPDDLEDKDRLQEMYESGARGGEGDGEGFGEDDARVNRKRRLDSSNVAKRFKDFKF